MKKFLILLASLWALAPIAFADDSAVAEALKRAKDAHLADSREWRALLHMQRDVLFRDRSSIDDPDFFLSPHGQTDPEAELDATVKAFAAGDTIDGEPTACHYPARYAFLKDKVGLPTEPVCERYERWKEKMSPLSASLIFSAYYLNNPASMYGHTFLKLSRGGYEESGPLLDYTINYAATANTNNGMMFAARGLLGGYRGRFSTDPYYVKIQKYNNMESRDLWEYPLNLDAAAIDRLIRHLWEMGGTSMTYYFFNKNCSYQLLPLLDVADPNLDLSRHFRFRAIPLDTLKAVIKARGLVSTRKLRPSHLRTMLTRRALLTEPEIVAAEGMALTVSSEPVVAVTAMPPARRALTLDAAYDLLRYHAGFYRVQPSSVQERERRIISLRREISPAEAKSPVLTYDVQGPEEGHGTGRVTFGFGGDRRARFQEVGIRAAIHDLEADPTGFIEGSQLEMFNIRLRHQENAGVYLEEAKAVEIISLSPWDRWVRKPSWAVRLNAAPAYDKNRLPDRSLVAGLDGGSGMTVAVLPNRAAFLYSLFKTDFETGRVLDKGYRLGYAGEAGVLLRENAGARLHVTATATHFFIGDVGNRVELRAVQSVDLSRNLEARLTALRVEAHQEAMLGLNLYW